MNHQETIKWKTKEFLEYSKNNILLCEGVNDGFYGTIEGIPELFSSQCYELPCSENASVGMALSASAYELTTIICFQRVEFALLAIEQFANNAAKNNFLAGGNRPNPCLFRLVIGRGWGQGPSHSQSFESMFAQITGLNVFMPVFPRDSRYIFENFINYSSPTISLEHRWTHYAQDMKDDMDTNKKSYRVSLGSNLTILGTSYNVLLGLKVVELCRKRSIGLELINIFSLSEIDHDLIKASVMKTRKVLALDLDDRRYSVVSDVLCNLYLSGVELASPPVRLANKGDYSPSSPKLAKEYYLDCCDLIIAVCKILGLSDEERDELISEAVEIEKTCRSDVPNKEFSGPF